jgi:hypothetical protein
MLFGSTRPLDSRTLGRLYPGGSAEYTDRFRAAAEVAVSAGFLLDEDLPEITALGGAAWPGALARAVGPSAQPDT